MRVVLSCALISCLLLGAGRVETRDAVVHRGDVTFDDGAVRVQPTSGPSVKIGVDDVRSIALRDLEPQKLVGLDDGTLCDPWSNADLGKVHSAGAVSCDKNGVVTITASGWGVLGGKDSLHWAYRALAGDGQIIARVPASRHANGSMMVGVMIRQDEQPNSNMAVLCVTPQGRISLQRRVAGEAPSIGAETQSRGDVWLRLARRGNLLTAYDSPDGQTWRRIDSCHVAMSVPVLAGAGAWANGNAAQGRATLDSVSVIPGTAGSDSSLTDSDISINEGVVLSNGSALAGVIVSADDGLVWITSAGRKTQFKTTDIAQLVVDGSMPTSTASAGKTGMLLRSGDFVEGEITSISVSRPQDAGAREGQITVTSVLFGPMQVAARETAVIYLRAVAPSDARYEIRSADGSRLLGRSLELRKDGVHLDGSAAENVVSIHDRRRMSAN